MGIAHDGLRVESAESEIDMNVMTRRGKEKRLQTAQKALLHLAGRAVKDFQVIQPYARADEADIV